MPDPFATADDAAGYAYPLPDASADGLLARATQALVDAAGFGIVAADSIVRLRAENGVIEFRMLPLVTAVTTVALVNEDDTTESVSGWHWGGLIAGAAGAVWLDDTVPDRRHGRFDVTLTQGLPSVPDSLKMLACAVAYRMAATPAAMSAGITGKSVGGVSWSASWRMKPGEELTDGELSKLGKIVPVRTVWAVGQR